MPPSVLAPPETNPPACHNVTLPVEIPTLAPWLSSIAATPGEVAAAQIDPRRLTDLAAHLLKHRIGYYWPKERVRRRGPKGWKQWERSLFAGTLFLDIGTYADRGNLNEAGEYCRFFGWRLGMIRSASGAAQNVMRRELASLEILLGHDPTLSARQKIEPGTRVRVIAGAFMGVEGVVIRGGPQATLQLSVSTLGQSVCVEIARELIESIRPAADR